MIKSSFGKNENFGKFVSEDDSYLILKTFVFPLVVKSMDAFLIYYSEICPPKKTSITQ